MRLAFIYTPVDDLKAALALYRDKLGFTEAWREGDTTVALQAPGSDVQLMLDADHHGQAGGPVFTVDDVAKFRAEYDDLAYTFGPVQIPGGSWTSFADPTGNVIHLIDNG